MSKYNGWAIVLIALWVVSFVPNRLFGFVISSIYDPQTLATLSIHETVLLTVRGLVGAALAIGIAVWLTRLAKRDGASPWIWCLMGLVFSVLAALLYLVIRIYERQIGPPVCSRCRYDLRGTIVRGEMTCPECGSPVPPEWLLTAAPT